MERPLEDELYRKIVIGDEIAVLDLLSKGADPNKITWCGKTSLGEAAIIGNINIVKLLIDFTKTDDFLNKATDTTNITKKKQLRIQKRKYKNNGHHEETVIKCKSSVKLNRTLKISSGSKDCNNSGDEKIERNQGYYVFKHSDGSSSDESKITNVTSPINSPTLIISPQAELEWDEDIVGNVAPTTTEDETWSSMYRWYAAILENTGEAIAAASVCTSGLDQLDVYMRTALHYASEFGHLEVVKLLINAGCKVGMITSEGFISLHLAVKRNHTEIVEFLLASGSQVNYKTNQNMTPLHIAASRGLMEMANILVNHGAYVHARDTTDRTALYLATGAGHVDIVRFLISAGANVNCEEIHGYSPLSNAVWHGFADIVEVLLHAGARVSPSHKLLHNAIIQREEQIVKLLSNQAGGINLTNEDGDTPLLIAVRSAQPNIIYTLVERGANINNCNFFTGINALHVLVESIDCPIELEEVLVFLLKHKIDINATSLTGDTALTRALLLHRDHAAVMLIRHGADVNAGDLHSRGIDNLCIATNRRTPMLASLLLKAGHSPTASKPPVSLRPDTTAHWVFDACRNPFTLADLCRIRIRASRKKMPLFAHVNALPLPRSLKNFLMIEDEIAPMLLKT